MSEKPFDPPLEFPLGDRTVDLPDVETARDLLMDVDWPVRGPKHREALDMCHKVLAGERSTAEAEKALGEAFAEAAAS